MLKDIVGIRLRGANYESLTDVLFFNPCEGNKIKSVKGALIYGRNGAGKSTLAKAVRSVKGETIETIYQSDFIDVKGDTIVLNEEEKSHIFVFDEDYVDKNIKFRDSGLETIIMLGQQAEIEGQLEEAQRILREAKELCDVQSSVVNEYENIDDKKSPKHYIREMRLALQGDDCWSGRDKMIKGNRQNTGVRDDTYKKFISVTTTKTRDQLIIDFNEKIKELRIAQHGDATILDKAPVISVEYNEEKIRDLLKVKIEKPELSEREQYLLGLVQSGDVTHLNNIVKSFSDDMVGTCPMCLQKVSEEYKQDLIKSVKKVLSKAVEEHQEALGKFLMCGIDIDFTPFIKLSKNSQLCINLVKKINEMIVNNNSIIQSKIDNPYTPCEQEIRGISNLIIQLLEAFSTFQYKKGIDKVSTDYTILECLSGTEYKDYFENLMYRLILNNGSHRLDQTKAMYDLNFFTVISKEEKQRTAKEILCFIYLLNRRHLLAHLEGCDNVEGNLLLWCNKIKNTLSN